MLLLLALLACSPDDTDTDTTESASDSALVEDTAGCCDLCSAGAGLEACGTGCISIGGTCNQPETCSCNVE